MSLLLLWKEAKKGLVRRGAKKTEKTETTKDLSEKFKRSCEYIIIIPEQG